MLVTLTGIVTLFRLVHLLNVAISNEVNPSGITMFSSERQFINAVAQAEKECGQRLQFVVGFADLQESAYHFYFEFQDQGASQDICKKFTQIVDKALKGENVEYAAKRDSFRVKDPVGHLLTENSFAKFKTAMIKNGARDGQFKMNLLMQDDKRREYFKELVRS